MRRAAVVALAAASGVAPAAGFAAVLGYTPVSDVTATADVGQALEDLKAALELSPRDWAAAQAAYTRTLQGGLTLQGILPAAGVGRSMLYASVAYYGSADYVHEFSNLALQGSGAFAFLGADRPEKMREELAMKGVVLQGVLMAAITHLEDSLTSCAAGSTADADGAPHDVDMAWGLYACSKSAGPIKLAEKRAPQFNVEAATGNAAGDSQVNTKLLQLFQDIQAAAQSGDCSTMVTKVPQAIAKMQIPVIQGMLREAYEVDPKESDEHHGADGFVEVAEGWAFARAVLPAIHACSPEAAAVIVRNMDTLGLGSAGPHVRDGFEVVVQAAESQYACLGIGCAEVNAMIDPWKTEPTYLWPPCVDSALPAVPVIPGSSNDDQEVASGGRRVAAVGGLLFFLAAAVAALSA